MAHFTISNRNINIIYGRCDHCEDWAVISYEITAYIMDKGLSNGEDNQVERQILHQFCKEHYEEWLFGKE